MTAHVAPQALPKQAAAARAPSLELRPSRDRFETEAENAAENMLRPAAAVGRPPTLSQLSRSAHPERRAAPSEVSEVVGSPGSPLGATARQAMERQFGSDFSKVRIHTDAPAAASARAIRATAYTAGAHIAFDHGAYNPKTPRGRHILAHELAHVVQQRGSTEPPAAVQRLAWYESIAVFFGAEGSFEDKELLAYLDKITQAKAHEGSFDSDNRARAIVRKWKAGDAKFKLDPFQKALLIQEMQDGPTLDDDENAILDLLELSDIAALRIMFSSGKLSVKELESDLDGAEYKRLLQFFATRFRDGRDALLKGNVEPKGDPGKGAPVFAYDATGLKKRLDAATSSDEVDSVAAEIFALEPKVRDKAMQDLGRERAALRRRLDDLAEKIAAEKDEDKKLEIGIRANITKGTLKAYDIMLQRVSRDIALTTSGKDLSKTVAPDATQQAEITKALKPDVKLGSDGTELKFDITVAGKKKYEDAFRKLLPTMVKGYWDRHVPGRGTTEHDNKANTHELKEFERIGVASKRETDKVFGDYYVAKDHPELKADTDTTRGSIHDKFVDVGAELAAMSDDQRRKKARRMLIYFFQSDDDVRAINRTFNASPSFDKDKKPLNDEAIILADLATEFSTTDDQVKQLNAIERGWVASARAGEVSIQIFRKKTLFQDRDFLWDMFQTLIHEYIHTLRAAAYSKFATDFGTNSNEYNTLIEGVDSFLDEIVWENVAPRVNDPELRVAVEGPENAKLDPIPVLPASRRRYASYAEAVKLVNVVGIRNLYAAYFQGDVKKIGG